MPQPTREKILDEVFKLVYIHGYNGTSMSMILGACEIPKGSLYHYFKSKKEMVLAVLRERIAPRMDAFYHFEMREGQDTIDAIIEALLNVAQKEELVRYGCPLNRLNQEMSPVDADFEAAINMIYEKLKQKTVTLLQNSSMKEDVAIDSLAEFIIASVWGSLSLSPVQSSKERYLSSVTHLIKYLKTLKK